MDALRKAQLLLVQDLVDGRLDADEASRAQALIDSDKELGDAAAFFRWLSGALPDALSAPSISASLERLLADFAAEDEVEAGAKN